MAMGELSAFVGQNYFWILVIGIILIMTLIGFIADKKNLVMIQRKPREDKKNNDETKELLNNVEEKSLADAIYGNASEENKEMITEDVTENVNEPDEVANETTDVSVMDTSIPKTINGMEIVDFESVVSNENDVPSELYAPLEGSVESTSEANVEPVEVGNDQQVVENQSEQGVAANLDASQSPIEVDLPDLNSADNQTTEAAAEDDIWKF